MSGFFGRGGTPAEDGEDVQTGDVLPEAVEDEMAVPPVDPEAPPDGEYAEAKLDEEVAQENAEHDRFLETYQPVITRLPEALQLEAEARAEELKAERVKTLVADLGISEDEAREQVYGPTPSDADASVPTSEDHAGDA